MNKAMTGATHRYGYQESGGDCTKDESQGTYVIYAFNWKKLPITLTLKPYQCDVPLVLGYYLFEFNLFTIRSTFVKDKTDLPKSNGHFTKIVSIPGTQPVICYLG